MQDQHVYNYAVIRVVPHVEREEFVNAGVIVICPPLKFLKAKAEPDKNRIKAIYPYADIQDINEHLDRIIKICIGGEEAGELGSLSQRERFHFLTSPKSTIIQTSPVHTGCCENPDEILEKLMNKMVRPVEEIKKV